MATIEVKAAAPYTVHIGAGLANQIADKAAQYRNVAIIYQPTVEAHVEKIAQGIKSRGVHVHRFLVPDAEAGKTLAIAGELWEKCGDAGITRADVIMGVGGGAATDLAGFIASTWVRGIDFISCPTSLLGMVDAGVGGKTGINNRIGKNLVGTFHEPKAVFIDLATLETLPRQELVSGMAEVIKCGFISDLEILRCIMEESDKAFDIHGGVLEELVCRSIQVKADIVSADLREIGLRENLNYGHTLAHAIEQREEYLWRHGNAVAVGMVFAAALAQTVGLLTQDDVDQTRDMIRALGLPVTYPIDHADELVRKMYSDKKNRTGVLRFVILDGFGNPVRLEDPSGAQLAAAFRAIRPLD